MPTIATVNKICFIRDNILINYLDISNRLWAPGTFWCLLPRSRISWISGLPHTLWSPTVWQSMPAWEPITSESMTYLYKFSRSQIGGHRNQKKMVLPSQSARVERRSSLTAAGSPISLAFAAQPCNYWSQPLCSSSALLLVTSTS